MNIKIAYDGFHSTMCIFLSDSLLLSQKGEKYLLSLTVKAILNFKAIIDFVRQFNGFKSRYANFAQEFECLLLVTLICKNDEALTGCKVDVHFVTLFFVWNDIVDQYVDEKKLSANSIHFDVLFFFR